MSKPSEIPRWAANASGTLATNTTAPSSGQMDTGWTPSQLAVSSYDNRFKAFTHLWLKWLNQQIDDVTTIRVPITAPGTVTATPSSDQTFNASQFWAVHLPGIRAGDTVQAIRARVKDPGSSATVSLAWGHSIDGVDTLVAIGGGTAISTGTGVTQTISFSSIGYAPPTNTDVWCYVKTSSGTGHIYALEFDVQRP